MRWPDALAHWPHADVSTRITAAHHRWHVQQMGSGPTVLLLHGAGGANHSWRDVLPDLAQNAHVVALDLPGHGLTQMGTRSRSGVTSIAQDVLALCIDQNWQPQVVVGHSAGGALALRMAQLAPDRVGRVVCINAALDNFKGLAGVAFPVMAKMLAMTPFTADFFARAAARPDRIDALLDSTGSQISPEGRALYAALVGSRDHVDGVLTMMAQWSLDEVHRGMPTTEAEVLLLAGENDRTVPPRSSQDAARSLPHATCEVWPELGHLMHEEAPARVAQWIRAWAKI